MEHGLAGSPRHSSGAMYAGVPFRIPTSVCGLRKPSGPRCSSAWRIAAIVGALPRSVTTSGIGPIHGFSPLWSAPMDAPVVAVLNAADVADPYAPPIHAVRTAAEANSAAIICSVPLTQLPLALYPMANVSA